MTVEGEYELRGAEPPEWIYAESWYRCAFRKNSTRIFKAIIQVFVKLGRKCLWIRRDDEWQLDSGPKGEMYLLLVGGPTGISNFEPVEVIKSTVSTEERAIADDVVDLDSRSAGMIMTASGGPSMNPGCSRDDSGTMHRELRNKDRQEDRRTEEANPSDQRLRASASSKRKPALDFEFWALNLVGGRAGRNFVKALKLTAPRPIALDAVELNALYSVLIRSQRIPARRPPPPLLNVSRSKTWLELGWDLGVMTNFLSDGYRRPNSRQATPRIPSQTKHTASQQAIQAPRSHPPLLNVSRPHPAADSASTLKRPSNHSTDVTVSFRPRFILKAFECIWELRIPDTRCGRIVPDHARS
ncbi:hypothetical protein B0H16DRAFT_1765334 [Mycena metata]|uniref:Uncharacterized protein n=1 Tax=Mycena metata TaxID=1033252 RepID=A0AAD7I622_9AGAR|nr:hypothetical protein B0H16DRAFT_1765334 [Mycena metata]